MENNFGSGSFDESTLTGESIPIYKKLMILFIVEL